MHKAPLSPDSTPLDLSPNMEPCDASSQEASRFPLKAVTKLEEVEEVEEVEEMGEEEEEEKGPQISCLLSDPDRAADREAVAVTLVTMDMTKAPAPGSWPLTLLAGEGGGGADLRRMPRKKQRKKPREDEKICRVCGDKALAHNFDAITCESCKAFFRRNALRTERNTCLFKNNCPITIQTRRFCPACRLKKCFDVGMKADFILDESERKARMDKVTLNRVKRLTRDSLDDMGDSQVGSSSQSYSLTSPLPRDDTLSQAASPDAHPVALLYQQHQPSVLQDMLFQQQQQPLQETTARGPTHQQSNSMNISPECRPADLPEPAAGHGTRARLSEHLQHFHQLQQQQPPPPSLASQASCHSPLSSPSSSTSYSRHAPSVTAAPPVAPAPSEQDFQHVPRDLLPSDPHMYWRLSEEEKTLLTQLSSAYQDTILTLPERVPASELGCRLGNPPPPRTLENIFETAEKNMRQIVTFVQRLGDFQMLRQDDQIATLQASGLRVILLRWSALFVVERDAWLSRYGETTVASMSLIFGHEDVIRRLSIFCRSVKTILKNDVTLYVLLHCLVMFDPREANIVDRQLINTFRDKYIILLKHYLESEYSFLYAERYMSAIMDKVVEIRQTAQLSLTTMRQFMDFIPPLMKQLLNLNECS